MKKTPFRIKAVLFDFDGTLTEPGGLDFALIKQTIGCPPDQPILEFIESLSDSDQKAIALSELDRLENDAATLSEPNTGAEALLVYLQSLGLSLGIISRNSMQSIRIALSNFSRIGEADFDIVISRDEPIAPKPSPEGILLAAEKLNIDPKEILVVGDFIFDIQAGNSAGATTVLLSNTSDSPPRSHESHYTIARLEDLIPIVRLNTPLPTGKLPNDLLEIFLKEFSAGAPDDPTVLIHPGIGEDTAAVDVSDDQILVLKSDPITFTTDAPGLYAVLINANDIATSGAVPRWFLTALLFPRGTTAFEIRSVMDDLQTMCRQCSITLCGGHTEITDAVTQPVISGMMVGTVAKKDLIDKRCLARGDRIVLTKGVAVEGTSIIVREFSERLSTLGVSKTDLEAGRQFLKEISILEEAKIARHIKGVSGMHDVTEGGLATALEELSIAGRHKIRIRADRIPIFPLTLDICELLSLDPLGLIGSGSLIISCREDALEDLMNRLKTAGIRGTCIGEVLERGRGVIATMGEQEFMWPHFEADEITRLY